MTDRIAGKVAIITGSTSGIGRASAELFAREGARVVVNGRRTELGQQVVAGIRDAGGEAVFVPGDISLSATPGQLVQCAMDTWGRLDILMNNAWSGANGTIMDIDEPAWDAVFAVVIKAAYLACRHAIPAMTRGGGGSIINIASVHGLVAGSASAAYEPAKAGLINMTRQIAVDFGRQGIRCNAICPGWIVVENHTTYLREHPEELDFAGVVYPIGRPGRARDVAQAALFLASEESSFITGQALAVDGGLTCQLQDDVANRVRRYLNKE